MWYRWKAALLCYNIKLKKMKNQNGFKSYSPRRNTYILSKNANRMSNFYSKRINLVVMYEETFIPLIIVESLEIHTTFYFLNGKTIILNFEKLSVSRLK